MFDLNGTGTVNRVGWASSQDGLLVMDRNADGHINDGRELFGVATLKADGQRAGNGFAALAQEDTNQDGKVSAADAHFDQIKVWVDANHNAVADAGELKALKDLGIVSMDVHATKGSAVDNGNLLGLVSSYETNDGKSHDMADVWFRKDVSGGYAGAEDSGQPSQVTVADLLADHGHSVGMNHLNDAAPPAHVAKADVADPHGSLATDPLRGLLDDPNKNPLI
jgi:hypothetical protein